MITPTSKSSKALLILLSIVLFAIFMYCISLIMNKRLADTDALVLGHEIPTLNSCVTELTGKNAGMDFRAASNNCYHNQRNQGLLNDFQIRRAQFSLQYSSNKIILWMVVILTLSGVFLAGLQLVGSYRLAQSGQQNSLTTNQEFSVEEGKLVFKSSVTGLFILLVSFAFFYVYIWKVYTIYEVDPDKSAQSMNLVNQVGGVGTLSTRFQGTFGEDAESKSSN